VDPSTEFAVRRRLPRVLGVIGSPRAIEGLLWALEDSRFEVRYQSARAIARLLRNHPHLTVDPAQILKAVDRELSVPLTVWQGYRLIDRAEGDEDGTEPAVQTAEDRETPDASRNLEHVFTLLASILARDAVLTARRGLESGDPRLRALAVEYLDSALSPALRVKLWALVGAPT
jgi:HEAT repeat protein